MDREIVHFGPQDIEIENFATDSIIHLFPVKDPHDAVEDILMGLYLLDMAKNESLENDKTMAEKEQPNYLIMAFAEIKRRDAKGLEDAQKFAFNFMEKMKNQKSKM